MSATVSTPFIVEFTGEGATLKYGTDFSSVLSVSSEYLYAIQYYNNDALTAGTISVSSVSSSGGYTSVAFSDGSTVSFPDDVYSILTCLATGAYVAGASAYEEESASEANASSTLSDICSELSRQLTLVGLYKPAVSATNAQTMLKTLCARYRVKLRLS